MQLDELAVEIHATAREKGFWEHENIEVSTCLGETAARPANPSIDGEKIALMHSELSEALDALRDGNMDHVEEELADTIIRILDYSCARGLSMDFAIAKKMAKNLERPKLHGRVF
jgi:hypothetical protein